MEDQVAHAPRTAPIRQQYQVVDSTSSSMLARLTFCFRQPSKGDSQMKRRAVIVTFLRSCFVIVVLLMLSNPQAGAQQKPLMAEDVFKNVQVLKGIPVNQFMETMGFFSAALV